MYAFCNLVGGSYLSKTSIVDLQIFFVDSDTLRLFANISRYVRLSVRVHCITSCVPYQLYVCIYTCMHAPCYIPTWTNDVYMHVFIWIWILDVCTHVLYTWQANHNTEIMLQRPSWCFVIVFFSPFLSSFPLFSFWTLGGPSCLLFLAEAKMRERLFAFHLSQSAISDLRGSLSWIIIDTNTVPC